VGQLRKQSLPFLLKTDLHKDKLELDPDNFNALTLVDRKFQPSKSLQGVDIKD
jgi:hypothetical protein